MAVLSRPDAGRLAVRTVPVPDPGDLLAQLPHPDAVAWVHRGAGLVGWGEAARVTLPAGEDRFTAGDLMMTSVLRILRHTDLVAAEPNLAAYQARCEARPAFGRALRDQMAAFEKR